MDHYTRWLALKEENPGKYARDIAGLMNLSEAELTFARVGHDAWRLRGEIREILGALEAVGETKCICRNDYAVHEQAGSFTQQHLNGHAGLVLNPRGLDLRLFLNQWASAFHLSETTARGERQSIQFFDHQGDAVLKVYTTDNTDLAAWADVLTRFIFADNPPLELKVAETPLYAENADAALVDKAWRAMTDVHQFFGLLMKGWLNIFNPTFTLHLLEETIAESWVTRKPTADGHVTSLELFAADGTQIAQLYGQRTEGEPEQSQWRSQIDALTPKGLAA